MSETITMAGQFEEQPLFEPLSLDFDEKDMAESMRLYLEFLALPEEVKQRFQYFDEANPRTGKSGYMRGVHDDKFIYHHTPDFWKMQNDMPADKKPAVAREFFSAADQMYFDVARGVKAKLGEWAEQENSPWIADANFPSDFQPSLKHHLRFLAYVDGRARGHYDKSFATAAIAQSKNGLRIGVGEDDLELVQRENFEPLIFRGYGWHQMHEMLGQHTDKVAAWHDVIDVDEQTDERLQIPKLKVVNAAKGIEEILDISRVAIVDFINPAKIYLDSTLEQTHTPIRWRRIGRAIMPNAVPHSFLAA
jgi:hypothetical protein